MFHGLPADLATAREYVGDTGVLVPAQDDRALAAAVLDLLGDCDRARGLGIATRSRAEAEFTLERSCERFLAAITALAATGANR